MQLRIYNHITYCGKIRRKIIQTVLKDMAKQEETTGNDVGRIAIWKSCTAVDQSKTK
jgi:hypothetical protein